MLQREVLNIRREIAAKEGSGAQDTEAMVEQSPAASAFAREIPYDDVVSGHEEASSSPVYRDRVRRSSDPLRDSMGGALAINTDAVDYGESEKEEEFE